MNTFAGTCEHDISSQSNKKKAVPAEKEEREINKNELLQLHNTHKTFYGHHCHIKSKCEYKCLRFISNDDTHDFIAVIFGAIF